MNASKRRKIKTKKVEQIKTERKRKYERRRNCKRYGYKTGPKNKRRKIKKTKKVGQIE